MMSFKHKKREVAKEVNTSARKVNFIQFLTISFEEMKKYLLYARASTILFKQSSRTTVSKPRALASRSGDEN